MSAHTRGPWTYSVGTRGAHVNVANDYNHPLSFGFRYDESLHEEAAANARLIAAAPEMYEALMAIVGPGGGFGKATIEKGQAVLAKLDPLSR